ncbi:hypothetical protein Tco_0402190 [Tanacetum coccineum]
MHIQNDPSFFLTNKTGAPQVEELGLIKLLCWTTPSVVPTTLSFQVPMLRVRHQVPDRFEIPLVESEEDPASSQEIL